MKQESHHKKNLRIAIGPRATGPYSAPSQPITDTSYWAEGPTVARVNGKWVIYFDKYTQHKMGAVQSADGKRWEDISNRVHFPNGTRHGTVFTISSDQFNKLKRALPHQ